MGASVAAGVEEDVAAAVEARAVEVHCSNLRAWALRSRTTATGRRHPIQVSVEWMEKRAANRGGALAFSTIIDALQYRVYRMHTAHGCSSCVRDALLCTRPRSVSTTAPFFQLVDAPFIASLPGRRLAPSTEQKDDLASAGGLERGGLARRDAFLLHPRAPRYLALHAAARCSGKVHVDAVLDRGHGRRQASRRPLGATFGC